jgi:hypothetical protein
VKAHKGIKVIGVNLLTNYLNELLLKQTFDRVDTAMLCQLEFYQVLTREHNDRSSD